MSRTRTLLEKKKKEKEASAGMTVGASTPQQPKRSRTQELLTKKQEPYLAPRVQTPTPTVRTSADIGYDIRQTQSQLDALEQANADGYYSVEDLALAGSLNQQLAQLRKDQETAEKTERQALIDSGEYRDATLEDLTLGALKQGYYNSRYGEESYNAMLGGDNEAQKYKEILEGEDYRFLPDGLIEEAVSGAANQLGQWARQWTNPRTLAFAGTAAGAAAIAGQAGPQVLVPEEVVTVPAAVSAALAAGTAASNFEIEAGHAYNELMEKGISSKTAKNVALLVGGGNAALEALQVDELVDSFKILKKSTATQGAAQRIAQILLDRGVDVAKETVQEVAQEGVTIAGTQIGSKLDKGEWAYNADEVKDRLLDTAKSSALSFGLLNVPGAIRSVTSPGNVQTQTQETAKPADVFRQEQPEAENRPQIPTPAPLQDTSEGVYTSEEKQAAEAREMALEQLLAERGEVETPQAPERFAPVLQEQQRETGVDIVAEQRDRTELPILEDQDMLPEQSAMLEVQTRQSVMPAPQTQEDSMPEIVRRTVQLRSDIQAGAQKTLGKEGYRAFEADFRNTPESDPIETYQQLTRAYNEGVANRRSTDSTLPAARYNAMFEAGRRDAEASLQAQAQQVGEAVVHKGGIDYADTVTSQYVAASVDKKTAKVIDRTAKALGVRVRFADSVADGAANAQIENGVVTIEKGNPNPVRFLFGHEITHRMQELAPAEYGRLRETVTAGGWADAGIKDIQSRYAEHGMSIDSEAALDEAVADYVGKLLEDNGELERFITRSQRDRTLLQKLRDAFRDLAAKLRNSEHYQQAKRVEERLTEAMKASMQQVGSAGQAQKNTTPEGGARYNLKPVADIEAQLGEIRDMKVDFEADSISVGTIPDIYTSLFDISELDMAVNMRHAYNSMVTAKQAKKDGMFRNGFRDDYHGMGVAGYARAIRSVATPLAVMDADKSGQLKNLRVSMILRADGIDEPLFGVIEFYSNKRIEGRTPQKTHALLTIYDKETAPDYVKVAAEKDRVLYIDKEQDLRGTPALQLRNSISDAALKKNVSRFNQKVNIFKATNKIDDTVLLERRVESGEYDADTATVATTAKLSLKDSATLAQEIARIQKEGIASRRSDAEIQADIRAVVDEAYQGFIGEYGAITTGEKPAREIQVPQKTAKDKKVSQTVRTVLEAQVTPETDIPTIKQMVAEGEFSYDVYTDESAIEIAEQTIKRKTYGVALAEWIKDIEAGKVSKTNTALGWALYNNAATAKDTETAMTILNYMVGHQRNAAQAVQATRILKKLTPDAQLYSAVKSVQKLEEDLNDGRKFNSEGAKHAAGVVGKAKQDAADAASKALGSAEIKRKGNRVTIDSNQAGEPFVFEYAQKVGEAVAKGLESKRNNKAKERTFLQQITAQVKRFAAEKMPKEQKGKALTAIDLLRDYVQNQAFYADAWAYAQEELREKYAGDSMFDEFINTGIGVDSNANPHNAIFTRALVMAAAESGEGKSVLRKQAALGFTGMAETIADNLIQQTGATGEMANTIRDAAHAYVYTALSEEGKADTKIIDAAIRSAMSDVGIKVSEVVASGTGADAKQEIISKLVGKYGFGLAEATNTAEVVTERFNAMCREFSQRKLESMFKERKINRKTIPEKIEQLARLGAFDVGSAYNQNAAERIFKEGVTLIVNEDLARQFMQAKTQEERDDILAEIYRDIGRQMPSSFVDKWNAWRYLAMLGNVRTHVRNIVGNAGFAPVVAAKNLTATTIEAAVSRLSGGRLERSKAFVGVSKADRVLLKAAWDDYAKVQDAALGGGKYSDFANANQYIEEGRRIFKNKALEAARRGNTKAMEQEDAWFSRPHYAAAMAAWCKQNGVTPEQIASGKAIKPARAYAIKEAQKATYRDTNALSQTISELGRVRADETNPVRKGVGMVMEGILPFRKTPANILARGLEYSPAGLANGIKLALWDVRKGTKTGAEAIDSISAGLTGTGLLALGVYMASQGLIRGHGDDDEKKNEYEELMGHQAYALELPDGTSVTLDWLAPECLPFFVGVNLWEQTDGKADELTLSTMLSSVTTVTEPLLEMSCLQSLNDVFDAVGYAASDGLDGLPAALASAATSYLTQALPTLLGQAERTGEDVRMTTYTEKNAFLTGDMQYTLGKASARLPGVEYQQIPYIDAWGRTESSGSTGERAFNNFLNPAYMSKIDSSAMEDELLRLYEETGDAGVLPARAAKYFNVGGVRKDLTAEEYVKYATTQGQTAYSLLAELTAGSAYRAMDDAEKADAVGKCFEYAKAVAKASVSDYKPEGWVAKAISTGKATGIKPEKYVTLYLQQKDVESLKDAGGSTISNSKGLLIMQMIYNTPGLTDKQRQALFEDFGVGKTIRHYNKALVEQKLAEMRKKAG